ncbi:MAG TPA: YetF domain-containing protein [Rhizomicrobium sp.]|nr:YetF domain-containing protein [Rhizomicrobium sp.]
MEQFLVAIFGVQNHISTAQEAARAVLIFSYGLILLRVSGPRMFGHWSALDITITIMVGSALARAMTGSAPLVGTMVAAAVMAFLHVVLAHIVARHGKVAHLVEGEAVTLIDHGRIDHAARKRNMISDADIREALRQEGVDGEAHVDNVKVMTLEPSGHLSVVKVDPCKPDRS